MNQYMAKDGDRLDIIIFKAYRSLDKDVVEKVLDANEHLLDSSILQAGDIVYLPEIEQTIQQSTTEALW